MLTDTKRPDSLVCTLAEVSRVGGHVRERLSADMMYLIGRFEIRFTSSVAHSFLSIRRC